MLHSFNWKAWFDRDKSVNAKKRVVKAGVEKVLQTLSDVEQECSTVLQSCKEKFGSGQGSLFASELSVLQTRLLALQLVLTKCPDDTAKKEAEAKLREFIQSFSCSLGQDSKSPESKTRGAPPSKSYGKLFLAADLWQLVAKCDEAETRQDLEAVSKELMEQRKPLLDLSSTAKATGTDLTKAMAEQEKQKANAQSMQQKASSVKSSVSLSGGEHSE